MFNRQALIIGMLAAASLLLESTLTRLLAVTQFYHFAFLVVSLALLGYGTSGTILSVSPRLQKWPLNRILLFGAIGFVFSVVLAYLVVNFLPFDSYSIAWDRRQIWFFFLYYLALTLPFTMSGLAAGAAISFSEGKSHLIYAANLCGSGLGALLAPFTLWLSGIPGSVLLSILIGVVGIVLLASMMGKHSRSRWLLRILSFAIILGGLILFTILVVLNTTSRSPLGIILSPYKGLSQASRIPGVETIFSRWNAISRVDVLKHSGTHHLPGLSYIFQGSVPEQLGLSLDADSLQPISLVKPEEFQAAEYLPEALGFQLRPNADTLVIESGGGLGVLQALSGGSRNVTVVMANPLEHYAAAQSSGEFNVLDNPKVYTVFETGRVFLARGHQRFDVVLIPLTDSYRPVSSGAYSLGENYELTVEAFKAAINHLATDGILIVTRWVQIPPSESLRLITTMVEALDEIGMGDPKEILVIYRSIQTMTILVKPSGWATDELQVVRNFIQKRKFDLVWLPGIGKHEINVFNRLPEPVYYTNVRSLLLSPVRNDYYDSYPFDIQPSRDNQPFFFHFFKWEQTPEVLSTIGHIWQPFGGSGYLVTIALLFLVVLLSFLLITLPLLVKRGKPVISLVSGIHWKSLLYFTFLGIGFMFVEIPLIQKSILYLGHPIVAFTMVVFTILVFSSLGSAMARMGRIRSQRLLICLAVMALIIPLIQEHLINSTLGWSPVYRTLLAMVPLAPLAVTMGLPFPLGIIQLEKTRPDLVPWVWAVNGSTSVVASVLAAILALTYGFRFVQVAGAMMYFGAILVYFSGFRVSKDSQDFSLLS